MKKQKTKGILRRILRYVRPYGGALVFALFSAVVSVGLSLVAPILIGQAVDLMVGVDNVDFDGIARILTKLACAIAGSSFFSWTMTHSTNRVAYCTVRDIRKEVFEKFQTVPLKVIDRYPHGDLINRMIDDVEQVSNGLLQGFTQLFSGFVTIFGTIGFMLSVNVTIAMVVILLTPLSLFVASFIAKGTHKMFVETAKKKGEIGAYVEEMIGNRKVVSAFNFEDRAQETFEGIDAELYSCGVKAQFYSAMTNPCTRFVNAMVYAAAGISGAMFALSGGITVGQLSSFLSYANQYTKPFNEITGVIAELATAFASAKRIFAFLDEENEASDAHLPELTTSEGKVDLEDVSFSYRPEDKLIEDFNLHVEKGQRVAIVGPTGCGKTTLINLLMRFYDVNEGRISVDGVPVEEVKRASLRSHYGMVLQDTWLFHATVRENIAYGRPDATDEEIIAAAKAAHAHSFIKRLEHGYDTVLSENGDNISQGQKQLLCIARIMLTLPPMLILDEATSSIDTRTEMRIQRAFAKMMEGRTSFIVAHRLSTIRESDIILVMRNGNVVEQGDHEGLLARNGFYAQLYNSQFEH